MESKKGTRVFVYGTLKPGGHYHDAYCGGFRYAVADGWVKGLLYDFPTLGYPGAIEHPSGKIRGFLLTFNHPETEVLSKLDPLEGYDPTRPPEQNEYYRKRVPVFEAAGTPLCQDAWCYFMEPPRVTTLAGILLPDGHWPL